MAAIDLRHRLAQYRTIFLDTMVFIYVLERNPLFASLSDAVLQMVEAGELKAVTSSLSLAEILSGPAYAQNQQAMSDYELYLTHFPNLSIQAVEIRHARIIAAVRAATRLRLPHAVQIAVAMDAGANAIVGNDVTWQGKTGPLDFVLLREFVPA